MPDAIFGLDARAAVWMIAAAATGGVIFRPFRLPEAVWAVIGAAVMVGIGLMPWHDALLAVARGTDVYLFLIGMMLLAELARREKLFDWLAVFAVRHARGSARRLFGLVYLVGTLVTVFLSNDATAVVLTPAVYAAARAAKTDALPHLLICAFVANAASFVLPISNPANLVVYQHGMPPLAAWLVTFALPSAAAITATYGMLYLTQRAALAGPIASDVAEPHLPRGGAVTALGLIATAVVILVASALGRPLGLPTAIAAGITTLAVLGWKRESPVGLLHGVSWSVLPLVAGLFILVEAVAQTGALAALSVVVTEAARRSAAGTTWGAGIIVAIACNLMNNLPAGLFAGATLDVAQSAGGLPPSISGAVLIGVDLGPNLSVTGSLATILWLVALRREGEHIGALRFLRLGLIVMPPALLLALAALFLVPVP